MSVEEKRKAFLEGKIKEIKQVQEEGLAMLQIFDACGEAEEGPLNDALQAFSTAELPRDKDKLNQCWLDFQAHCYYLAWRFADAWYSS